MVGSWHELRQERQYIRDVVLEAILKIDNRERNEVKAYDTI